MPGSARPTKPMGVVFYLLVLLLLEVTWVLRWPPRVTASPSLSKVENRTKKYYYSSYPPANPSVRLTRTIIVRESTGIKLSSASIVMYNSSVEDVLAAPEARLATLKLSQEFYPLDDMAQLVIRGNASASAYQSILRQVRYKAPQSLMKTAAETRFWRNVSFQVINRDGVASNVVERPVRIDAVWKVLREEFPGILDDTGRKSMGM